MDDERDYSTFNMAPYEDDFIDHPETKNAISSVLSAMVTHIESKHHFLECNANNNINKDDLSAIEAGDIASSTNRDCETNDETLDDLFSQFEHDILCDLKIEKRSPDVPEDCVDIVDTVSERQNVGLMIHEEIDATLEQVQTAPIGILDSEEDRLHQI